MAKIYANEFTEQELKDLVAFYKSPLGQKLLRRSQAIQGSMAYMNHGRRTSPRRSTSKFRAEMSKRGKEI